MVDEILGRKKVLAEKEIFSKKGQFNVEYFVVLTLFLIFSLYFAFRLVEFYPSYLRNVREEILRSDSFRLSEMLINDDGWPKDWNIQPTRYRIGLSEHIENKTNLLSFTKVLSLNGTCNPGGSFAQGYPTVKNLVGAEHDFLIEVNNTSTGGTLYTICGYPPSTGDVAVVRRIVSFDSGGYGELTVQMWW